MSRNRRIFQVIAASICVSLLVTVIAIAATTSSTEAADEVVGPETPSASSDLSPIESQVDSQQDAQTEDTAVSDGDEEQPLSLNGWALLDEASVETFSLAPELSPAVLDGEHLASIEEAVAAIEHDGMLCSFTMISLDDGRGIQYRRDRSVYSASCMKAVYAYYIISNFGQDLPEWIWQDIEYAIIYSDNDAYESLSSLEYYNEDYIAWLERYGIYHSLYDDNGNYPFISSASLSAVWLDITAFIDEGSEQALRFSDMLEHTEVSFMREGLGPSAYVRNKAGWIAEYDYGLNATNDAGIIEMAGKRYVLSIMTSQPCSTEAAKNVGRLACAVMWIPYGGQADFEELFGEEEEPEWEAEEDFGPAETDGFSTESEQDEDAAEDI